MNLTALSGNYIDVLPDGRSAVGTLESPGGPLLHFHAGYVQGVFCVAGQGNHDGNAWVLVHEQWRALMPTRGGTSIAAIGPRGVYVVPDGASVHVFNPFTGAKIDEYPQQIGARGIACLVGERVYSVDELYGAHGLAECVKLDEDIFIGQGLNGGLVIWTPQHGLRRIAERGDDGQLYPITAYFPRAHRDGNQFSAACWDRDAKKAITILFTASEIITLPVYHPAPPKPKPPLPPPPDPKPDPEFKMLIAPNEINTVARMIREHPEVNTRDEEDRATILDYAIVELGGKPWGRKARNRDGTNKNTDGLTYLRPDGDFEIYDVLDGTTGAATWTGYGPFKQGENGYWAPGEIPVNPPPPPVLPLDLDQMRAELRAAQTQIAILQEQRTLADAAHDELSTRVTELQHAQDPQKVKELVAATLTKAQIEITLGRTFGHSHSATGRIIR